MIRAVKAMIADVEARKDRPTTTGMTAMHSIAMRYLEAHSDVTTMELAAHLRVTKQSASEIVALLGREGYVRRRPHPVDGRARILELTDDGATALAGSRARWNALAADWQSLVGPDDLATVRRAVGAYLEASPPDS